MEKYINDLDTIQKLNEICLNNPSYTKEDLFDFIRQIDVGNAEGSISFLWG